MSEPDLSFLDPSRRSPAPGATADAATTATEGTAGAAGSPADSLVAELRAYQAELESQNKVLRYSQAVAESASERFETLFASMPLALMVIDEHDMVVQANSMAHRSFQPTERDRPLTALMPFVSAADVDRVHNAFAQAENLGRSEVNEVVFDISEELMEAVSA